VRALFIKFMLTIGSTVLISIVWLPVCGFSLSAGLQDGPDVRRDDASICACQPWGQPRVGAKGAVNTTPPRLLYHMMSLPGG